MIAKLHHQWSTAALAVVVGVMGLSACSSDEPPQPVDIPGVATTPGAVTQSQEPQVPTQEVPTEGESPASPPDVVTESQDQEPAPPPQEAPGDSDVPAAPSGDKPSEGDVVRGIVDTLKFTLAVTGSELSEDFPDVPLEVLAQCVVDEIYDKASAQTLQALAAGKSWEVNQEDFPIYVQANAECGEQYRN